MGRGAVSSTAADNFLRTFFGDGNALSYASVMEAPERGTGKALAPWIEAVQLHRGIIFLPRVSAEGITWYGFAHSEPEHREMREVAYAAVGPTYSSFRGASRTFEVNDPIDQAVLTFAQGRAIKIAIWPRADTDSQSAARLALLSAARLRAQAPSRDFAAARPDWRVLRDFEFALLNADEPGAHQLLAELADRFALGEPSLSFLRIRALARFERWNAMLELEELPWLLNLRRPPQVTSAIVEALYHERLAPCLTATAEVVRKEASRIEREYRGLFHADPVPLTVATAATAVAAAALADPPRHDQAKRLLEASAELSLPAVISELVPSEHPVLGMEPASADPLEAARTAMLQGDAQEALAVAAGAVSSVERAWLMVQAAATIQALEAAEAALEAVAGLPESAQRFFDSPVARSVLLDLRRLSPSLAPLPSNWIEWLERVNADPSFTSARDVAALGETEWTTAAYDDAALGRVAELIRSVPASSVENLVRSVAHLLGAFPAERARAAHGPIYLALLQHLAFDSRVSPQELASAHGIIDLVLERGLDAAGYRDLVDLCGLLWDLAASPSAVDWASDVSTTLAFYPAPDSAARQGFVQLVLQRIRAWPHSLDTRVRSSFEHVGDVIGIPVREMIPPPVATVAEQPESPWERLSGKIVGIYSLTRSASTHAEQVLKRLQPECRIITNDDHVCTAGLVAMAKGADVLVVVTQSAKHAATECISANLGGGYLAYASGRGASAILRAVQEAVQPDSSNAEDR